jgi:hypothetical protein
MTIEKVALTTIRALRGQYRFAIPEYQRGFAWGESQWRDLWRDTASVARRTHVDHFSGSLMLRAEQSDTLPEVVDGQQRLVCISLLLRALGESGFDIEFCNNEPLQTYFDYFARGDVHMAARLAQHRSFYARNMQDAAGFFHGLAQELGKDERTEMADALLDRFKLFVLAMGPTFDVHVAFETINNRGKPLSLLEKLKNRLIYLCSIAKDEKAGKLAVRQVHSAWKNIYHWLGKGAKLLGDDEFLRAHAVGWFRKEHRAEWLTTQLFDEDFSANTDAATPEVIEAYVSSLEHTAAWWYYLNCPDQLPPRAYDSMRALERTGSTGALPLLLWAIHRSALIDPQLMTEPRKQSNWIVPFTCLVQQAERFAVLVLLGNDRLSNVGQSDFNRAAYALAHAGTPIDSQMPPPPDGHLEAVKYTGDYLKSLVDNWRYDDDEDAGRADSRFSWPGFFDPQKMAATIANRLRSGDGFYKWTLGRLIVHEWESHLRGDRGLPEKKPWEAFAWDESIEHIYPQNPTDGWARSISLDGRTSEQLKKAVVNSIGNLLLLSGSRNASVSNNLYTGSAEPSKDKRDRYRGGSYSEWQVAEVCKDGWTVAAIAARGIAMMRLAQQRWGFELVSKDAPLVDWLPVLFGDVGDRIRKGVASHERAVDGRALGPLVARFESVRPR